jgi:glycolate oxidase
MILMPEPKAHILARREEIAAELRRMLPHDSVIDSARALKVYESDGLSAYRQPPMLAVLPETTAQVSEILKFTQAEGIRIVPRGAGTSLSGGALPLADGILVGMGKFNRILDCCTARSDQFGHNESR